MYASIIDSVIHDVCYLLIFTDPSIARVIYGMAIDLINKFYAQSSSSKQINQEFNESSDNLL
ncbi:26175_t:CDS:2, partial [Gigaspora margarita]